MRTPVKELLTCKELAAALHVGRVWICAAVQAGAPRVTTRLYEYEPFLAWLRANPDFTRREIYTAKGKRKPRSRRRSSGKVHF